MSTIYERVKRIIVEQLGVDEELVTPTSSFTYDFNADSSDLAEMLVEIEKEFSTAKQRLEISDAEFTNDIYTVQDMVDFISDGVAED
ncbi:MAG TPA: acyl carrier protein [Dehalococcoidia bacterium]|nr:acyl carrier protein [Dehalococcoidia bacterium]